MNSSKSIAVTIFCFAAIYIVWGSTYLAIAYGIEDFGPFTLTSIRFFIASALMFGLTQVKKESKLTKSQHRTGIVTGLLLIGANGMVCFSEKKVSSGLVAIIIGSMPIWILLVNWILFQGAKPSRKKMAGAVIGLAGISIIALQSSASGEDHAWNLASMIALFFACVMWASGTIFQRKMTVLKSGFRFSGLQMFAGACGTGVLALVSEHPWNLQIDHIKPSSYIGLFYLIIFGSVISYTAYGWLARNVESHKVSTYALVNPIVAVFLGVAFRHEVFNINSIFALALVLLGLFLLLFQLPKKI